MKRTVKLTLTMRITSVVTLSSLCALAQAGSLSISVVDSASRPLPDAIVYVELDSAQVASKQQLRSTEIEQKGRKFSPLVTVVQTGTAILFPNNDTVRHHIYSFSPAKVFEQKLYSGVPEKPVIFDKPGTVVLGCNIHDQMLAYVLVVDTPYFAKTDSSGKAKIEMPLSGKVRLKAWHFGLPAGDVPEQAVTVKNGEAAVNFKLNAKAAVPVSDSKPSTYKYDY